MKISKMEFSQVNPIMIKSTEEKNQSLKIEFMRDKSSGHNDQENFDNVIKNSPLDDRIPNKNSLKKLGYILDSVRLDMNGGKTYYDENGNKIRICNFDGEVALGMKGATAVTYENKDGNFTNNVYYDPDGNPVKGEAYVKSGNGTVTKYEYEYDFNGNKILKNKHTLSGADKEVKLGDGRVIVIPANGKPDVISDKPLDLEPSGLIDKLKNVDLTKNNNKIINDKQVKKADTPESILENFGIKFNIKERIERQNLDDNNAFKLLKAIKNDEVWYYDVFENEDGCKYYKYSNTDRFPDTPAIYYATDYIKVYEGNDGTTIIAQPYYRHLNGRSLEDISNTDKDSDYSYYIYNSDKKLVAYLLDNKMLYKVQ